MSALSDAELDRAWLAHFDACRLFRYSEGKPGEGGMSVGQERFHRDASQFRYLRASNQVGKTIAGSAEAWWYALGRHPFRPNIEPGEGWIVMPDLNDWAKVSAKLREMEPPGALHPACRYDTAKGYMYGGARRVMCSNGSLMVPKSGSQQQTALAGATIGWIWFDEPPRESHWGEALSRVAVRGGAAWLTFTPIGKPLAWLRDYFLGNTETGVAGHPEWSETRLALSPESCPHRTPEDIATQIASYSPWEYAQRVEGSWSGVTKDRYLSGFSEGCVIDVDPLPSMERIGIGIDHGEQVGKEYAVLVGTDGYRSYALDEYNALAGSTPAMDAAAILAMLARWGVSPFQVSICRGDTNSAGKLGSGLSVNAILEAEFARLTKMSHPPFRVAIPNKGKGSVDAGLRMMNTAFISGRLIILPSCPRLIHSAQHWRGKGDSDLKDAIDAARYVLTDFIDTTPRGASKLVMV